MAVKLSKQIKKTIKKAMPKKSAWDDISRYIIRNIKAVARKGTEIATGNKFPELKSTKHRQYLEKYGNASGVSYGQDKPNVTISGELLESVKSTYNKKGNQIKMQPTGKHKKYKGKTKKVGSETENFIIAKHLKKLGFDFMGVNDKMKEVTVIKIKAQLRRALKK